MADPSRIGPAPAEILRTAADRLDAYAALLDPERGDTGTVQLAAAVRSLVDDQQRVDQLVEDHISELLYRLDEEFDLAVRRWRGTGAR